MDKFSVLRTWNWPIFTDEISVYRPIDSQKDQNRDISTGRLLRTHLTFWVMVSKLSYTNLIFIEPEAKSTGSTTETCCWCRRWCKQKTARQCSSPAAHRTHDSQSWHVACLKSSGFPYLGTPFPQVDIIGAMVMVWRVRGKIIRSLLCNIVCNNCAQFNAQIYEQT